jgi:hypothetical protein
MKLLHLDAQGVAGARGGGSGQPAVEAYDGGDRHAVRKLGALDYLGDDANAAELSPAPGQQEDAILIADVDWQRRGDGGKDDRFVERNQRKVHGQIQIL